MLAEGNKSEGFDEGAGMQRACANDLEQILLTLSDGSLREDRQTPQDG